MSLLFFVTIMHLRSSLGCCSFLDGIGLWDWPYGLHDLWMVLHEVNWWPTDVLSRPAHCCPLQSLPSCLCWEMRRGRAVCLIASRVFWCPGLQTVTLFRFQFVWRGETLNIKPWLPFMWVDGGFVENYLFLGGITAQSLEWSHHSCLGQARSNPYNWSFPRSQRHK